MINRDSLVQTGINCEIIDGSLLTDDDMLWRRVPPQWIIFDKNLDCLRPSSAAFQDHPNGSAMSVGIESIARQHGREPTDVLAGHDGFALVGFGVGCVRSLGQVVRHVPLPGQPEHGEVEGKKTGSVKKRLSAASNWVVAPPQAP